MRPFQKILLYAVASIASFQPSPLRAQDLPPPQIMMQLHQTIAVPSPQSKARTTRSTILAQGNSTIPIRERLEAPSSEVGSLPTAQAESNGKSTTDSTPELRVTQGAGGQSAESASGLNPNSIPAATSAPPTGAKTSTKPRSAVGTAAYSAIKLLERDFSMPGYNPPSSPPIPRRAPPAPLDGVFPSSEFLGTNSQAPMGVNDYNNAQYPLEQALWAKCPILRKNRIRIYGWLNPGGNYGTSRHSNFPMSYIVASRAVHWDQVVLRCERVPDTVQQEHIDWGFRLTSLYGEDYRFTTAKGWVSTQLLKDNNLTGWDPCEVFGLLYVPKIGNKKLFDGLSIRVGRYISCPDIEAQLAPDNYLYTHSIMFTVDTYTQTGIQGWLQLNKNWNVMGGFHGGADTAPWTNSTVPTGQALVRWVSNSNKDSVYGGVNDINGLPFRNATNYNPPGRQGKDNLQQVNINWTHVFNRRFHTVTEWYDLWTRNALRGGTVSDGPVRSFGGGGGPGQFLPGPSRAIGVVNYSLFKVTNKDYLCVRPIDFLFDNHGWRTGFPTNYQSFTVGWCHRFSDLLCIRPEIRLERSLKKNVTPYDNGTRQGQLTFACDLIQRF